MKAEEEARIKAEQEAAAKKAKQKQEAAKKQAEAAAAAASAPAPAAAPPAQKRAGAKGKAHIKGPKAPASELEEPQQKPIDKEKLHRLAAGIGLLLVFLLFVQFVLPDEGP